MGSIGGPMAAYYANMPDEIELTVNGNHPVYRKILSESDKDKSKELVHNLADLALLSQGLLKGDKLAEFINRNISLMQNN
jgi:molecular chaperone HtpG